MFAKIQSKKFFYWHLLKEYKLKVAYQKKREKPFCLFLMKIFSPTDARVRCVCVWLGGY